MKIILITILLSICSISYASTMNVNTGLGYITDSNGNIVCKYDLPIGQHPLKDGYTYTEVATRKDLDKIEIYQEPVKSKTLTEKLQAIGLTREDLKEAIK